MKKYRIELSEHGFMYCAILYERKGWIIKRWKEKERKYVPSPISKVILDWRKKYNVPELILK